MAAPAARRSVDKRTGGVVGGRGEEAGVWRLFFIDAFAFVVTAAVAAPASLLFMVLRSVMPK